MILVIDNTKNLKKAYMTPKLLSYLDSLEIKYIVVSKREEVNNIIYHSLNIRGCILTGGPLCLSEELTIESINKNISILLHLKNIPILGICFGFQIMAASYGGKIDSMKKEDEGIFKVKSVKNSIIINDLDNSFNVFQSHKDTVIDIPPNFDIIAIDNKNNIQIIENLKNQCWGVQFHPEGLESTNIIIKNFIDICYKE